MSPSEHSIELFAERLKSERRRIHLSQEDFGKMGGVSKATQYLYESYKTWPSLEYLSKLKSNGIDVSYIVSGVRVTEAPVDWAIIKNAFLFVHHSFSQRGDRTYSTEQLFDVFKSVVESASGVLNQDEKVSESKTHLEDIYK